MNLLQVRQKFRDLSGRFDLVNEDGSDNGADFFINEGRKYLDRMDETQKSWGVVYRKLDIGTIGISFAYCRAIKEIWITSNTSRWQLEKMPLQDLLVTYLSGDPNSLSQGRPSYYSPCINRILPRSGVLMTGDIDAIVGFVEVPSGYHEYNAAIINVPADQVYYVTITGLFYSEELVNDTDENHWTVLQPLMLIMAAMRQVEVVNRNTQGVNDWDNAISTENRQLGFDLVEELIAEVNQMEG